MALRLVRFFSPLQEWSPLYISVAHGLGLYDFIASQ